MIRTTPIRGRFVDGGVRSGKGDDQEFRIGGLLPPFYGRFDLGFGRVFLGDDSLAFIYAKPPLVVLSFARR